MVFGADATARSGELNGTESEVSASWAGSPVNSSTCGWPSPSTACSTPQPSDTHPSVGLSNAPPRISLPELRLPPVPTSSLKSPEPENSSSVPWAPPVMIRSPSPPGPGQANDR